MTYKIVCEEFDWSEETDTYFTERKWAEAMCDDLNLDAYHTFPFRFDKGDEKFWIEEV